MDVLGAAGVPTGAVFDTVELQEDSFLRSRGTFTTVQHAVRGDFVMHGLPVKMSDSLVALQSAPLLGQDGGVWRAAWMLAGAAGRAAPGARHLREEQTATFSSAISRPACAAASRADGSRRLPPTDTNAAWLAASACMLTTCAARNWRRRHLEEKRRFARSNTGHDPRASSWLPPRFASTRLHAWFSLWLHGPKCRGLCLDATATVE